MRLFTKNGHDFFVVSSLLQKSLRRGDVVLASRAANELLPKYANYIWNRLMTVSAEDCSGLVTGEVVALYDGWAKVNGREKDATKGRIFFAKAIVLLAKAKHSRDADELNILVSDRYPEDQFLDELRKSASIVAKVRAANQPVPVEDLSIPDWVYDVHTRTGKRMGMTKQRFLRDEHDALTDAETIFLNFDDMLASDEYVQPELDL